MRRRWRPPKLQRLRNPRQKINVILCTKCLFKKAYLLLREHLVKILRIFPHLLRKNSLFIASELYLQRIRLRQNRALFLRLIKMLNWRYILMKHLVLLFSLVDVVIVVIIEWNYWPIPTPLRRPHPRRIWALPIIISIPLILQIVRIQRLLPQLLQIPILRRHRPPLTLLHSLLAVLSSAKITQPIIIKKLNGTHLEQLVLAFSAGSTAYLGSGILIP